MPLTEAQFLRLFPNAGSRAGVFVPAINRAAQRFAINTPARLAAFLAQTGHESGGFLRLVENLNYSAQGLATTWPTRFAIDPKARPLVPNALANQLARKPELIANATYAARNGNGPISSGDGWRYRGRGLLQITGRDNYRAAGRGIGQPLEAEPELAEQPEFAAASAAWWWQSRGLNQLADVGNIDDIGSIINTGKAGRTPIGAAERRALFNKARGILNG
ncbi:glycoside hydrolase family 19 protein [Pseudomonas sp. NPDC086581]|uniref:glycoside hydrolase family 19 protein n=1 Tax=Pseudomonas sp. NPDC086581 TaxID=3364432 RepID=UPI00380A07F4